MEFLLNTSRPYTTGRSNVPVRINKTCISIQKDLLLRNRVSTGWCANIGRQDGRLCLVFSRDPMKGFPRLTSFNRRKDSKRYSITIPQRNRESILPLLGDYTVVEVRHKEDAGKMEMIIDRAG